MNHQLKTLFVDNPYLPEQVWAYCNSLPGFREAEREYYAQADKLCSQLGRELFDAFDEAQSWYMAKLVNAYYLFGLGLRQEVLTALQSEMS